MIENNAPIDASYEVVIDQQRLEALVIQWGDADYLAVDTEFIRTNTFLAQPGLSKCRC